MKCPKCSTTTYIVYVFFVVLFAWDMTGCSSGTKGIEFKGMRIYRIPLPYGYCEDEERGCVDFYAVENLIVDDSLKVDSIIRFVKENYSEHDVQKYRNYEIEFYRYEEDEFERISRDTTLLNKRSIELNLQLQFRWRKGNFYSLNVYNKDSSWTFGDVVW
jgi:hypothetical protein